MLFSIIYIMLVLLLYVIYYYMLFFYVVVLEFGYDCKYQVLNILSHSATIVTLRFLGICEHDPPSHPAIHLLAKYHRYGKRVAVFEEALQCYSSKEPRVTLMDKHSGEGPFAEPRTGDDEVLEIELLMMGYGNRRCANRVIVIATLCVLYMCSTTYCSLQQLSTLYIVDLLRSWHKYIPKGSC